MQSDRIYTNEEIKEILKHRRVSDDTDNSSGCGNISSVPDIIAKPFNWGAFCLTWVWGISNRVWITFLSFGINLFYYILKNTLSINSSFIYIIVLLLNVGLSVWYGIKGNTWAWQKKKWQSVEEFHHAQRQQAKIGITLYITCFLAVLVTLVAMVPQLIRILRG